MKKFILVEVPIESTDYFINKVGCLRYSYNKGRQSTAIEPIDIGDYLTTETHKIIGESIFDGKKVIIIEVLKTEE